MGVSSLSFHYNSGVRRRELWQSRSKILLLNAALTVTTSHTPPFLEYGLSKISYRWSGQWPDHLETREAYICPNNVRITRASGLTTDCIYSFFLIVALFVRKHNFYYFFFFAFSFYKLIFILIPCLIYHYKLFTNKYGNGKITLSSFHIFHSFCVKAIKWAHINAAEYT